MQKNKAVVPFTFLVFEEADTPTPSGVDRIGSLLQIGMLPHLLESLTEHRGKRMWDGLTHCHANAAALLADLHHAGFSAGWRIASGHLPSGGAHSWLEHEGWAFDLSSPQFAVMHLPRYLEKTGVDVAMRWSATDYASNAVMMEWPPKNRAPRGA